MPTTPVFPPVRERPVSQCQQSPTSAYQSMLRDNFTLTTWLLIGALLQGLITLLPYPNIALVAPVAMILLYQIGRSTLIMLGFIPNHLMKGVIPKRTTIVFADEKTGEQEKPGDRMICAIMLSVRSNHPLGIFAPGFKEAGEFFNRMFVELDEKATELGYLGSSRWLASGDRGYASENMTYMYFESAEKVHEYAHGPIHTEAVLWWTKVTKQMPHLGIMHEIMEAPRGHWEGVYLNYHPTGLGATTKEVLVDGQKVFVNPQVYVKGPLLTSSYRMSGKRISEKYWPEYGEAMRVQGDDIYGKA